MFPDMKLVDAHNLKKKKDEIPNNASKQAKNESKPHSNPQEFQKKIKPMKRLPVNRVYIKNLISETCEIWRFGKNKNDFEFCF